MADTTKRGPGRPPIGRETTVNLTDEQLAWLDKQKRPKSETVRALIDKAMSK